jgi:O-antigen/teichoic acid export membrane protein
LGAFSLNVDVIMLGWFRSAEEIGYYSAGQKVIPVLYTLPAIIASSLLPLSSRLVELKDEIKLRLLTEKGLTLVFALALPLAVGGAILAKPIISLLYGQEYILGAAAFKILIASVLVVFPGTVLGNIILAHDKQRKIAWYVAATSVSNVAMNFALIPSFGIVGAAIATITAQFLYNLLVWRFVKKLVTFSIIRHTMKITLATVAMGAIAFLFTSMHIHILATISVATIFYFTVLALLKERIVLEAREIIYLAKNGSS